MPWWLCYLVFNTNALFVMLQSYGTNLNRWLELFKILAAWLVVSCAKYFSLLGWRYLLTTSLFKCLKICTLVPPQSFYFLLSASTSHSALALFLSSPLIWDRISPLLGSALGSFQSWPYLRCWVVPLLFLFSFYLSE